MLISNFVYEKQGASRKKVMQYRHCLPVNEIFGWDSVHMSKGKYLLMHSIIYRTKTASRMWIGTAEAYILCG